MPGETSRRSESGIHSGMGRGFKTPIVQKKIFHFSKKLGTSQGMESEKLLKKFELLKICQFFRNLAFHRGAFSIFSESPGPFGDGEWGGFSGSGYLRKARIPGFLGRERPRGPSKNTYFFCRMEILLHQSVGKMAPKKD